MVLGCLESANGYVNLAIEEAMHYRKNENITTSAHLDNEDSLYKKEITFCWKRPYVNTSVVQMLLSRVYSPIKRQEMWPHHSGPHCC